MYKLLVNIPFYLFLAGCSLKSPSPAPVQSLNFTHYQTHEKGQLNQVNYRVKAGDTLYSIAWGADKDVTDLAKWNSLSEPYLIFPGQLLKLENNNKVASVSQPVSKKPNKNKVNTSELNSIKNKQVDKKTVAKENSQAYILTSDKHKNNKKSISSKGSLPQNINNWQWPVKGQVISHFSSAEQGNKGIKIAGQRGEAIKAAANGRVVYAGNGLRGYGNLIIIRHNNDFLSAYAHTERILVKEKQQIQAGQVVATMGSSGGNRVMLHFEIRRHGKSVNPLNYLPKVN